VFGPDVPSRHTSGVVAVASVLHEFYGLKVALPAHAITRAVAWRVMDEGDHWGRDVVFGATFGWVVGHTVARSHAALEITGFEVLLYPGRPEAPTVGLCLSEGLLRAFHVNAPTPTSAGPPDAKTMAPARRLDAKEYT
jgi:hypothetical protein